MASPAFQAGSEVKDLPRAAVPAPGHGRLLMKLCECAVILIWVALGKSALDQRLIQPVDLADTVRAVMMIAGGVCCLALVWQRRQGIQTIWFEIVLVAVASNLAKNWTIYFTSGPHFLPASECLCSLAVILALFWYYHVFLPGHSITEVITSFSSKSTPKKGGR